MSERLATALEQTREKLAQQVEEAEAELARARARARELRQSLAIAREFAGIGASIERAEPVVPPATVTKPPSRSRLDLTNPPKVTLPPRLSLRQRAALEGLRRARPPHRERSSFSPDVVLKWDDDSPFSGTYSGRKETLALLELVIRQLDPAVDPAPALKEEDGGIRVDARPALWGATEVRIPISAFVRFDERDRIRELTVTPAPGEELDRLVDAVIG